MNPTPMQVLAHRMTDKLIETAPQAAADVLAPLATHEILLLVKGLKAQRLIALFNCMANAKGAAVLRRLPLKQAAYVLARLEVPQATNLWKEFATPYRESLKENLSPAFVKLLQSAGTFAPQSVGKMMQTDVVSVHTEQKVAELVAKLKNLPRTKLPDVCVVTGKNDDFKGIIRTVELAFFNPAAVCGSVMHKDVTPLHPQQDVPAARAAFAQAQLTVLPVVDEANLVLGVLEKSAAFTAPAPKTSWWHKLKG